MKDILQPICKCMYVFFYKHQLLEIYYYKIMKTIIKQYLQSFRRCIVLHISQNYFTLRCELLSAATFRILTHLKSYNFT